MKPPSPAATQARAAKHAVILASSGWLPSSPIEEFGWKIGQNAGSYEGAVLIATALVNELDPRALVRIPDVIDTLTRVYAENADGGVASWVLEKLEILLRHAITDVHSSDLTKLANIENRSFSMPILDSWGEYTREIAVSKVDCSVINARAKSELFRRIKQQ